MPVVQIESRTAAQSAEESAAEIAALQAQVEEMQQDSYEGMCALGIETDRVEALVEALASAGIDPNPILQDVENKHLEAAIADEMGGEDDEAGVTGGSEGETTDVGTSGVQEQAQAPVQSAEQELTSLGESQEVQVCSCRGQSPHCIANTEPIDRASACCSSSCAYICASSHYIYI